MYASMALSIFPPLSANHARTSASSAAGGFLSNPSMDLTLARNACSAYCPALRSPSSLPACFSYPASL